jgi:hypothetical protein
MVHDDGDYTALFLRSGTPIKRRVMADGTVIPRDMPYEQRSLLPHIVGDAMWHTHYQLRIHRERDAHSISLFWSDHDWSFRFYYVNLEAPVIRLSHAFDTADHVLDIVVEPDLSWHWKDEDEFATALRLGRFSKEKGNAIREEGKRVLLQFAARAWPFDDSLETWRPPAASSIPSLPTNWDKDSSPRATTQSPSTPLVRPGYDIASNANQLVLD